MLSNSMLHFRAYSYKSFDYNFRTRTLKSSNQYSVFIGYDFLIGCFVEYEYKTHEISFSYAICFNINRIFSTLARLYMIS